MRLTIRKPSKDLIASILLISFYFTRLLNYVIESQIVFYIGMGIAFSSIFLLLKFQRKDKKPVVILSVLYFLMIITNVHTNNLSFLGILFNLQYIGLALVLYKYKINPQIMYASFYIHVLFFTYHIFAGTNPNIIYNGASRNLISVTMLIQTVLLYISLQKKSLKISYIPALLLFLVSLWAMGRSGIIASSALLIGIISQSFETKNRNKNIAYTVVIVLLVIFNIYILGFDSIFVNNLTDNISKSINRLTLQGMEDNARALISKEYYNELNKSILNFFLGVPIKENSFFYYFNYNLHNSYLTIHAYYGLLGLIIVLYNILISIFSYFRLKDVLSVILFLTILLRIYTDIVAFPGVFDPLIYYFIFSSKTTLNKRKNESAKKDNFHN